MSVALGGSGDNSQEEYTPRLEGAGMGIGRELE